MVDARVQSLVSQIDQINNEIIRLNERLIELRNIRKSQERGLLDTMRSLNIQKVPHYTLASLEKKYGTLNPKEARVRRSKEEKRREAIGLLRRIGVPDPESFIAQYRETQRTYQ